MVARRRCYRVHFPRGWRRPWELPGARLACGAGGVRVCVAPDEMARPSTAWLAICPPTMSGNACPAHARDCCNRSGAVNGSAASSPCLWLKAAAMCAIRSAGLAKWQARSTIDRVDYGHVLDRVSRSGSYWFTVQHSCGERVELIRVGRSSREVLDASAAD